MLSRTHVKLLITMIEACSQRGAFQASELHDIGVVYRALQNMLEHIDEEGRDEEET